MKHKPLSQMNRERKLYRCIALNGANIIETKTQGHTEEESIRFCKQDLMDLRWKKEIKDYHNLSNFKFVVDEVN